MEEAEYYSVTYKAKSDDIARQTTARYTLHDAKIAASKMSEAVTPITHIKCWDMSGKGAMIIYKTVAECNDWTSPKTPEFDVAMMSQTVFQAIWGSFSEDLSLLTWMTDCKKWFQRRQMGATFAKAESAKEEERLVLPKMIYYSKLASSNITQLMTETNDQLSTNPVWSGYRQV